MEKMNRITAVLLMVVIGCVTVFQCHHHDVDGHAFFMTYFNNEITGGFHDGDCHDHDCGHDGQDRSDPCGMHLSEMLTVEEGSDVGVVFPSAVSDFVILQFDTDFSGTDCYDRLNPFGFTDKDCLPDIYVRSISRRGPPCAAI